MRLELAATRRLCAAERVGGNVILQMGEAHALRYEDCASRLILEFLLRYYDAKLACIRSVADGDCHRVVS